MRHFMLATRSLCLHAAACVPSVVRSNNAVTGKYSALVC
jgi:hypothetical protein